MGKTEKLELKNLIFVDNDRMEKALETIAYVQGNLFHFGGVSEEVTAKIEILADFHFLDRDKQSAIMYSPDNVILTWSMFTTSHYNSLWKLSSFIMNAGISDITGKIYIDTANGLRKALSWIIKNPKQYSHYFIRGLETNNIIGFDNKETKFFRYRFDATNDDFLRNEDVDINSLLALNSLTL